jgi:hypothetical protein
LGIFQRRNKQEYVEKGRWRKKGLGSENDLAQRDLSSGGEASYGFFYIGERCGKRECFRGVMGGV